MMRFLFAFIKDMKSFHKQEECQTTSFGSSDSMKELGLL